MMPNLPCPVVCDDPALAASLLTLAPWLAQNVQTTPAVCHPYCHYSSRGLTLYIDIKQTMIFHVDFLSAHNLYRQRHSGKRQSIARACGISKNKTVLDLTAGFGRDGYVLASLGFDVCLIEQHPIVAALLMDGVSRLYDREPTMRLVAHYDEGRAYLRQHLPQPDVIYLDPMFGVSSSALVKKDMQILQLLCHESSSPEPLLADALRFARDRVVVKRHRQNDPLPGPKPTRQIIGKKIRYDVYVI